MKEYFELNDIKIRLSDITDFYTEKQSVIITDTQNDKAKAIDLDCLVICGDRQYRFYGNSIDCQSPEKEKKRLCNCLKAHGRYGFIYRVLGSFQGFYAGYSNLSPVKKCLPRLSVLSFIIAFSIALGAYLDSNSAMLAPELSDTAQAQSTTEATTESQPSVSQKDDTKAQEAQDPESDSETVYVTNSGTKYHIYGCRYLKSVNEITLGQAKQLGYTPCGVCFQ